MIPISWIFYLPIKHREALSTAAGNTSSSMANQDVIGFVSLSSPGYVLSPWWQIYIIVPNQQYHLASLEHVWMFPTLCSLLSYSVRSENTLHTRSSRRKRDSLGKELSSWFDTVSLRYPDSVLGAPLDMMERLPSVLSL